MSKAEMEDLQTAMSDEYKLMTRFCEIEQKGELTQLQAIFTEGLGHCERTAHDRIKFLIASNVIISFGKFWKFNNAGNEEHKSKIALLQSLKDSGVLQIKTKDTFEQNLDKANRERYRAPQE